MKIKRISEAEISRLVIGMLLLAVGGGIIFTIFITPGNQLFLALLGGMLTGVAGSLILSAGC